MGKINKAFLYAYKRPRVLLTYVWRKMSPILPAGLYLKVMYRIRMGYWMDFNHPVTFNEKLQWLKLNDHNPDYIKMVDKYEVKDYVANILGMEYIIPTLGVWDGVEDIEWDKLPNQFVLKCTHDSGGLVICKDKARLDIETAKKKLKKSLSTNYYNEGKEWPYKHVKPRIIAEKYMTDGDDGLKDYKFFCFNGEVKFFKVDYGRYVDHHANYYSPQGDFLAFGEKCYPFDENADIHLPSNLREMVQLAQRIAEGHSFVRVDLYNNNGNILFGEITFFPFSGFGEFNPKEYDQKIGGLFQVCI